MHPYFKIIFSKYIDIETLKYLPSISIKFYNDETTDFQKKGIPLSAESMTYLRRRLLFLGRDIFRI